MCGDNACLLSRKAPHVPTAAAAMRPSVIKLLGAVPACRQDLLLLLHRTCLTDHITPHNTPSA